MVPTSEGFEIVYYDRANPGPPWTNALDAGTDAAGLISFNPQGQLLRDPWVLPGLHPYGIVSADGAIIVAGSSGAINTPLPSTVAPLGPLDYPSFGYDIALAKYRFDEDSLPPLQTNTNADPRYSDPRYIRLLYPPPTDAPSWDLQLTSPLGAAPFRIYPPLSPILPAPGPPFVFSAVEGTTPASIKIACNGYYNGPLPVLIATPQSATPIQLLAIECVPLGNMSMAASGPGALVADASGNPVEGDINLIAWGEDDYNKPLWYQSVDAPYSITASSVPSWLEMTPLTGTTPATIHVRAATAGMAPGDTRAVAVNILGFSSRLSINIAVSRPAQPAHQRGECHLPFP